MVRAPSGATLSNFTGPVTLAIRPGAGTDGAKLTGTTTVTAMAGVATFVDLSIDKEGSDYVLVASAPDLAVAYSAPFAVTARID